MNESYTAGLSALKRSFAGMSETPMLIDIIASESARNPLSLLDVGTGDGEGLVKVISGLRQKNIRVRATGIDKYSPPGDYLLSEREAVRVEFDFDAWSSEEKYDVVVARQSVYYLAQSDSAVVRLANRVVPGGLLIIVVWTEHCFLNHFSKLLFGDSEAVRLTSGRVADEIFKHRGITPQVTIFRGPTFIQPWLEQPDCLRGILEVLHRSPSPAAIPMRIVNRARRILKIMPTVVERQNGIVWARL